MILQVHELVTTLSQKLTVGSEEVRISAIRPHLLRWLSPAGSLYLEVRDASNALVATSETIAISSLPAGNYLHGYIRFLVDCILAANSTYSVVLNSSGYTFSESAWIGWCTDFDLRKYDIALTEEEDGFLDVEMWETNLITKGTYP